jgi:hypothetical protein
MKLLANPDFNIVIVDDAETASIVKGWNSLAMDPTSGFVAQGEVAAVKMVGMNWKLSENKTNYIFDIMEQPTWISSMGIASYHFKVT